VSRRRLAIQHSDSLKALNARQLQALVRLRWLPRSQPRENSGEQDDEQPDQSHASAQSAQRVPAWLIEIERTGAGFSEDSVLAEPSKGEAF